MHGSHFLDADELRASTFVRHVELYDTLGSTNDRAAELARDATIELPALIAARHQTDGRGRGDHKWWSSDGALTFSLLIEPSAHGVTSKNWPALSLTTAVAVCDAVSVALKTVPTNWPEITPSPGLGDEPARSESFRVQVKWPNDVLVNDRKVAGILIESPGGAVPAKDRLIIGVGINVNNSWHNAPSDLSTNGIALCDVESQPLDRQSIIAEFLRTLERRTKQLSVDEAALQNAWQVRCWLTGRDIAFEADGRTIEGRCTGLAEDGALLVKTSFATERFYSGAVRQAK